jgi:aquaporin Z
MVMIYAGGHISGGHYNPAVSLGVFLRGRLSTADLVPYWIAQILGGLVAGALALYLKTAPPAEPLVARLGAGFAAELVFTFALVFVVLNTATAKATSGNSYFGLAIGFTVLAGAFAVGDISGGAFNPAVAIGAAFMGMLPWNLIWLYLLADALGGALAALAFNWLNPADR